jgi:hypothetical protein
MDQDPGSGAFLALDTDEKIRIRDKHPGSATLALDISKTAEVRKNI